MNGQTAAVLSHSATCSANVTATSPAGTYASSCSGAAAPNYTVHYVPGVVTVGQATITVLASGGTQTYGDIVPPDDHPCPTASFRNGDTAAVLSQPAVCTAGVSPDDEGRPGRTRTTRRAAAPSPPTMPLPTTTAPS